MHVISSHHRHTLLGRIAAYILPIVNGTLLALFLAALLAVGNIAAGSL